MEIEKQSSLRKTATPKLRPSSKPSETEEPKKPTSKLKTAAKPSEISSSDYASKVESAGKKVGGLSLFATQKNSHSKLSPLGEADGPVGSGYNLEANAPHSKAVIQKLDADSENGILLRLRRPKSDKSKQGPPRTFFTPSAVEAYEKGGLKSGTLTEEDVTKNHQLASSLLADGLNESSLSAALKKSGVPAKFQDPTQLKAAVSFTSKAPNKLDHLSKTLSTFQVAYKEQGAPPSVGLGSKLAILKEATGFDKFDLPEESVDLAYDKLSQAINGEAGTHSVSIGRANYLLKVDDSHNVTASHYYEKPKGSLLKKALPVVATALTMFPATAAVGVAMNSAIGAKAAVDGLQDGDLLGAVAGAATAVSGVAGLTGAASAATASKIATGASTLKAVEEGDVLGLASVGAGLAGGAAAKLQTPINQVKSVVELDEAKRAKQQAQAQIANAFENDDAAGLANGAEALKQAQEQADSAVGSFGSSVLNSAAVIKTQLQSSAPDQVAGEGAVAPPEPAENAPLVESPKVEELKVSLPEDAVVAIIDDFESDHGIKVHKAFADEVGSEAASDTVWVKSSVGLLPGYRVNPNDPDSIKNYTESNMVEFLEDSASTLDSVLGPDHPKLRVTNQSMGYSPAAVVESVLKNLDKLPNQKQKYIDALGPGSSESDLVKSIVSQVSETMNSSFEVKVAKEIYNEATAKANKNGVTVVVSAGNDGDFAQKLADLGIDVDKDLPSDFFQNVITNNNTISVGAVDDKGTADLTDDIPADFTQPSTPDIVASGVKVALSDTVSVNGTSFSAPKTTALIAQLVKLNPHVPPAQLKDLISRNALETFFDPKVVGNGILDAEATMEALLKAWEAL